MQYIRGDLVEMALHGDVSAFGHGCNCQNTMRSGIAGQIAKKIPILTEIDSRTIRGDRNKLGQCNYAILDNSVVGFNLYTQFGYGRDKQYAEVWAISSAINNALSNLEAHGRALELHLPMIGAGLGGGDWNEIADAIVRVEYDWAAKITIVQYVQ